MTLPEGVTRRQFDGQPSLATRGESIGEEATDGQWRRWDPNRSKVAAMIELGMEVDLAAEDGVLYLGAASGTTVSHVADIAGPTYAVEFAPRPLRDLIPVAENRPRLFPILADARRPDSYAHVVESGLDVLIQDVATTDQAAVAVDNAVFLAPEGTLLLAIKARSEDVTRDPGAIFEQALDTLESAYEVRESRSLEPYHEAHLAVRASRRSTRI
ncbi:MAG: fibrillarin-like rRNA/tRNA 2'-O-methyltransferase [Halodesulfurarchaeum sp.]